MVRTVECTKMSPALATPAGMIDFRTLAKLIGTSNYLVHARTRGFSAADAITALVQSPKGIAALSEGNGKVAADAALAQGTV